MDVRTSATEWSSISSLPSTTQFILVFHIPTFPHHSIFHLNSNKISTFTPIVVTFTRVHTYEVFNKV